MDTTPVKIAKALNKNRANLLSFADRIKSDLLKHCKAVLYTPLLEMKSDGDDLTIVFPLLRKILTSSQRFALDAQLCPVIILAFRDELGHQIARLTLTVNGVICIGKPGTGFPARYDDPQLAAALIDILVTSLYQQRLINC